MRRWWVEEDYRMLTALVGEATQREKKTLRRLWNNGGEVVLRGSEPVAQEGAADPPPTPPR
jgi:hypothetical protein